MRKSFTCRQKVYFTWERACDVNVHLHLLSTMWINPHIFLSPAKHSTKLILFFCPPLHFSYLTLTSPSYLTLLSPLSLFFSLYSSPTSLLQNLSNQVFHYSLKYQFIVTQLVKSFCFINHEYKKYFFYKKLLYQISLCNLTSKLD